MVAADDSSRTELEVERERLRRARGGDLDAFGELVVEEASRLRRTLARFVADPEDLDDLVQDTFVRAHDGLDRFDPTRRFGPWLRTIGVNLALDLLRSRQRRPQVEDAEAAFEQLPAMIDLDAEMDGAELRAAFERALEELPIEWAAVLKLRVLEEMSYAEIADTLSVPTGTVMSRLSRGRALLARSLRAHLGRQHEREEDPS